LKKVVILTRLEKMVLPVAPLFDLGVDFKVFLSNYLIFKAMLEKSCNFDPVRKNGATSSTTF
jgi:hypothetical protein